MPLLGSLSRKFGKAFSRSEKQPEKYLEDDISNLLPSVLPTLTPNEKWAIWDRIDSRTKNEKKLEATIASVEEHLQQLQKRRNVLCTKNNVAEAIAQYESIAQISVEDNISVLATDYVPGRDEQFEIRSRLYVRRQRIECMEEAIQQGKLDCETRESFLVHIAPLKQACDVGRALLAPIRRLPTEILGNIFVYAVPALNLYPLVHDRYPTRTPLDYSEPHPHWLRIQIGQVCHMWRRIALETPRLWKTIALNFPLSSEISHLERCLQNSKACQLDVFVDTSRWFDPANEDRIVPVLALIRGELNRIRLFISQNDFRNHVVSIFPGGADTVASCMEFCCFEQLDFQKDDLFYGGVNSPRLKTLILIGANHTLSFFPTTSFSRLHQLVIGRCDTPMVWHVLVKILSSCPCLKKLIVYLRTLESYESSIKVTLPALESIMLGSKDPTAFSQLIESIYGPILKELKLECLVDGYPSVSNILDSLPEDSATSLRSLILCSVSFTGEDVANGLRRLQNIRFIGTYSCTLDGVFFSTLVPVRSPGDGSWTCFNLKAFEFDNTALHDEQLMRLLQTRMLPDTISSIPRGYLTSVRINGYTGLCDQCTNMLHQLRKIYKRTLKVR